MTLFLQNRGLLNAFRQGESSALTAVYEEYVRPLYALLSDGFSFGSQDQQHRFAGYRSVPWLLENAVQETFVRAFASTARQGYDGLRPYRNYLFSVARNLVLDQLRSDAREILTTKADLLTAEDEIPMSDTGRSEASAEEQLFDQEVAAQCAAFVAGLDVWDRALFDTRFHQGLSVERSARELGISEHQVKSGERALKRRFFRTMKACGYFEGYRLDKLGLAKVTSLLCWYVAVSGR